MTLPLYFTSSIFSGRIKKVLSKKVFEIFRKTGDVIKRKLIQQPIP